MAGAPVVMKILYGVPSEGMGHATRSKVIIEHLLRQGHDVRIATSGRAIPFFEAFNVLPIKGFHLAYDHGTVSKAKTIPLLLNPGPLKKLFEAWIKTHDYVPEVIISDFESFTFLFARLYRIPLVNIDNNSFCHRCHLGVPVPPNWSSDYHLAKALIKAKTGSTALHLISCFFPATPRKHDTEVVPPILRDVVLRATPSIGSHILVYQTSASQDNLIPELQTLAGETFLVYGFNRDEAHGNVTLKSFSQEGFVADLASCRAVITNGGFSLITEAVFLHKPVCSFPIKGQFEQFVNGAHIQRCNYGRWFDEFSAESITAFLEYLPTYTAAVSNYQQDGNGVVLKRVDAWLAENDPRHRAPSSHMSVATTGSASELAGTHAYEKHTFKKPRYCAVCGSMLKGIHHQGLKCTICGRSRHQRCADPSDCREAYAAYLKPDEGSRVAASADPLVIFINPKSGEQQGVRLLEEFAQLLTPDQVFDLTAEGGPTRGLQQFASNGAYKKCRLLVCGGDGTPGWVLSAMDELGYSNDPPMAVLPLGTGNDISRVLGWGPGYRDEAPRKILDRLTGAIPEALDRWTVSVNGKRQPLNNYFSVGVDTDILLRFHTARQANPENFQSRGGNKLYYCKVSVKELCESGSAIAGTLQLVADGVEVGVPTEARGIIIANIPSYGGGADLWGDPEDGSAWRPASFSDGLLDVSYVTGVAHLAQIQAGVAHATRLRQCRAVTLHVTEPLSMQIDGEPWAQEAPATVEITYLRSSPVLVRQKLKSMEDLQAHAARHLAPCDMEVAIANMGTGDIVLHHGTSQNSARMQKAMHCYFSHCALIVRDPPAIVLQRFQVERPPNALYVLEATDQVKGVRLTPVRAWIEHEQRRAGEGYMLAWRELGTADGCPGAERTVSHFPDLAAMMLEAAATPYERHKTEMFKALVKANVGEELSSVFCSEMVAWAYKAMSLIPKTENASNWPTDRFSHYFGADDIADAMAYLDAAQLAPEVQLILPVPP